MLEVFEPEGEAARDRRAGEPRRAVSIPATILCADGRAIPCVLREMSPGGARLSVSRRHALPEAFTLTVQGRETAYPVRRVWRRLDAAGIALDAARPAAPDAAR